MKKDRKIWILYFLSLHILYFQCKYRFNHPEKTETELFLDFFKAFTE